MSEALAEQRRKVERDHPMVMKILRERAERLRELAALWQSAGGSLGGAKRCVESLASRADLDALYDFLTFAEASLPGASQGGRGANVLTLDVARDLLPLLIKMLGARFENYVECALRYVRMLLQQFTPVIQSSRASAASVGVDLSREERVARANDCYAHFKTIYDQHIAAVARRSTPLGELAKDTRAHLEKLLFTSRA